MFGRIDFATSAPKRFRGKVVKPEDLKPVSGRVREICWPTAPEQFVDYAIVIMAGKGETVKGKWPFYPDFNFHYNFQCVVRVEGDGEFQKEVHEIVMPGEPPFEPLALSLPRLKLILSNELSIPPNEAEAICSGLLGMPELKGMDPSDLQPDWLIRQLVPPPPWLAVLARRSTLFRYPFMKLLRKFWPIAELNNLNVLRLMQLSNELEYDPERFCYAWRNGYSLPELTLSQLELWAKVYKKPFEPAIGLRLRVYANCKAWMSKNCQLAIPPEVFREWQMDAKACVPAQILMPAYILCADGQHRQRWLIHDHVAKMAEIGRFLSRLFTLPADSLKERARPPPRLNILNAAQLEAYGRRSTQNFGLVLGDAGTGKSLLTEMLKKTFPANKCLGLAYFGRVASNMRKRLGTGMTIHRLWTILRTPGALGTKLRNSVRVLLIDEGSVLTVELFYWAVSQLPNLRKVWICGDDQQMSPPSPGPIFNDLIRFYAGTPIISRLTEIMRVDEFPGAEILRDNSRKIAAGRMDLVYTRDLADPACPWIVLHRFPIPKEAQKGLLMQNQRVEILMQSLAPVLKYLTDPTKYQIITQTNDVLYELNLAMHRLLVGSAAAKKKPNVYRPGEKIMFTKNNDGNALPEPKDAVKRAAFHKTPEYYLRSDAVMNGEKDQIKCIEARSLLDGKVVPLEATNAPKPDNKNWQTIVVLQSGNQINLSHYQIGNIVDGNVATVSSAQGSEYKTIVVFIQQDFSSYLSRRQFYTAVTRAKRRVIVICKALLDSLDSSDIGKIIKTVEPPLDNVLAKWLPAYVQPPVRGYPDEEEEEEEGDESEDAG